MKKLISFLLAVVMVLSVTGCSKVNARWQEQYDLGVKYVNEAKYEEAILAFTKAIEIDPKQARIYIALADVYVKQGNIQQAGETIDSAIKQIGDSDSLHDKKEEIGNLSSDNNNPKEDSRLKKVESSDGTWFVYEYDENGTVIKYTYFNADGTINYISHFNEDGYEIKNVFYQSDDEILYWLEFDYDENGRKVKTSYYNSDGSLYDWSIMEYGEGGSVEKRTDYDSNGNIVRIYEFNNDGSVRKLTEY